MRSLSPTICIPVLLFGCLCFSSSYVDARQLTFAQPSGLPKSPDCAGNPSMLSMLQPLLACSSLALRFTSDTSVLLLLLSTLTPALAGAVALILTAPFAFDDAQLKYSLHSDRRRASVARVPP